MASSQTSELSSFIELFDSTNCIQEKLEHLTSITSTVLPGVQLHELERKLFSRLLPKVHNAVLETLDIIVDMVKSLAQDQTSNSISRVQALLQAILSCLECLEACVNHTAQFTDEILISHIQSLPFAIIRTIQATFRHCKESSLLYGELFQLVSDDLSSLFRRTYQLQKAVMDLIERVQLTFDATEEELIHMASVCHEVLGICILIGEMDTSLLVNTWKVLNRMVTKHKDHIKNHLDVDRIITHLCLSVEAKFTQCIQLAPQLKTDVETSEVNASGDVKALSKMLKIVRFLMGHLMNLVKEFNGYLDNSFADLFHLLLALQSMVPPCLTAPPTHDTALRDILPSVLVVIEPLLGILVTNKRFADILTRPNNKDIEEQHRSAFCFTLTKVIAILPLVTDEVFAYWVAPSSYPEEELRISIIQALFKNLYHASAELSLPVYVDGVMCKGKPAREVSFYEHVCTRLCALVAVSSASCFHTIEQCLLENVLSGCLLPAVMSVDVWCFMARWGSANLCSDHTLFLCELLLRLHSESKTVSVHLQLLIKRLMCLLATEHQENLISRFSPATLENIPVWSIAPLQHLQDSVRKKVCCSVTPLCIKYCHSWVKGDNPTGDRDVRRCLACLRNIYSGVPDVRSCVPPVHHAGLINLVNCVWGTVHQNEGRGIGEEICCQLMDLTGMLVPFLQPEDYVKVLGGVRRVLFNCQSDSVLISSAQFLSKCGTKEVPSTHENSVFDDLSKMYTLLVSHSSWIVHQHAFESVKSFAEVTRYTHIMADCVPERLLPVLSDFLNQVPYSHEELSPQHNATMSDTKLLQMELKEMQIMLAVYMDTIRGKEGILQGKSYAMLKECVPNQTVTPPEGPKLESARGSSGDTKEQQSKEPAEPQPKRVKCDTTTAVSACKESSGSSMETDEGDRLYWQALDPLKTGLESIVNLQRTYHPSKRVLEELQTLQASLSSLINQVS